MEDRNQLVVLLTGQWRNMYTASLCFDPFIRVQRSSL
jgi:hypothetical protein